MSLVSTGERRYRGDKEVSWWWHSVRQPGMTEQDGSKGEAGRGWVQGHRNRDSERVSYMEVPRYPHNAINSAPSVVRENRKGRGGERYRKIPGGQGEEEGDAGREE